MNRLCQIILLLYLFLATKANGCSCRILTPIDTLRKISYKSEIIFLGELVNTDTIKKTYTLKILELYKGHYADSIIHGHYYGSCSLIPTDVGKWIIYADFESDNQINISECTGSRSSLNPMCLNCYDLPPPVKHSSRKKEIQEFDEALKTLHKRAIQDWNEEINILRAQSWK